MVKTWVMMFWKLMTSRERVLVVLMPLLNEDEHKFKSTGKSQACTYCLRNTRSTTRLINFHKS